MILLIIGLIAIIILLLIAVCKLSERNTTLNRLANHYKDLYEQEKAKAEFYAKQFKEGKNNEKLEKYINIAR